jgi:tetratricopeptide (TPR) repeat protein
MLAIFPESFDVAAASDMFELDEKAAQNVLSELVRRSLVEWNELTNRYSLHDLLRVFARSVLSIASLSSGKMRHSNYYLNTLGKFNEIYKKGGETQLEGIHIFDKELENIKAGQNWAANHMDINPAAVQNAMLYPHAGAYLIQMRLGEEDQLQWHEAGLSAARILQNKYYEAASLDSLGTIYLKRDDAKTALSYLKPALDISREMNNEQGAAASLNNIGSAYAIKKDYKQAIIFHKDSLRIVRKKIHESNPNYKIIEGHALHNIGNAYWEQNQYKDSLEYYQRAYMVKNTNGDLLGANTTLVSIASNLYRLGNKPKAIEKISQAIRVLGTANHPILDVAKELLKEWTQK